MAQIFGRNSFINAGEEGTYGTICAAFQNSARLYSVSLARTQQRDRKADLSTSDGAFSQNHFDIFEEAGGAIEIPLRYDHAGLFLYAACGQKTTTPDGALFIHDYKCGTTDLPAISIQLQRGSGNRETFLGCKVQSMEISGAAGEEIKASFEIIAQSANTRSGTASPTFGDGKQAFHYESSAMQITPSAGGATVNYKLINFTLTLNNSIERKNVLGSKLTEEPEITDFRSVELSAECYQENDTLYDLQLSGTPHDIVIEFVETGTSNYIKLLIHNAVITDFDDAIDTVGRLTQSFTFLGFSDSSNEALEIQIRNDRNDSI
tara:strand:- start:975 stop:1934 length:960 start_codon:yes stop_codon:yes gene_type:complete